MVVFTQCPCLGELLRQATDSRCHLRVSWAACFVLLFLHIFLH